MKRVPVAAVALAAAALVALATGARPASSAEASPDSFSAATLEDTSYVPIIEFVPDTSFVPDTGLVFVIEAGSRLYQGWKEEHRVRLGETFPIGDTEWSARVIDFLPDFRLVDGRPVTASREMNNPAARIAALGANSDADTTWAFLNFPPHFSARAFFTFRLNEIVGMPLPVKEGAAP